MTRLARVDVASVAADDALFPLTEFTEVRLVPACADWPESDLDIETIAEVGKAEEVVSRDVARVDIEGEEITTGRDELRADVKTVVVGAKELADVREFDDEGELWRLLPDNDIKVELVPSGRADIDDAESFAGIVFAPIR